MLRGGSVGSTGPPFFVATVNPDAIRKRAARLARTNVQEAENQATTPVEGGNTGNKLTPQEVVKQVDATGDEQS